MPHTPQDYVAAYTSLIKGGADSARDLMQKHLQEIIADIQNVAGDAATKTACVKVIEAEMSAYNTAHAKMFP